MQKFTRALTHEQKAGGTSEGNGFALVTTDGIAYFRTYRLTHQVQSESVAREAQRKPFFGFSGFGPTIYCENDHELVMIFSKGTTSEADNDIDVNAEFADLERTLAHQPLRERRRGEMAKVDKLTNVRSSREDIEFGNLLRRANITGAAAIDIDRGSFYLTSQCRDAIPFMRTSQVLLQPKLLDWLHKK